MASFDNLYNKALSAAATQNVKSGFVRVGDQIFHMNVAAMRKWAANYYEPSVVPKIGKLTYVGYQGVWHRHPVQFDGKSELPGDPNSKDMRIIHYESLNTNGKSPSEIRNHLEAKRSQPKNDMRHYKAMLTESKKVKWPTSYATDLTNHDKRELSYRLPELPVGWVLRDSGTQLIFPEKANDHGGPPGKSWVKTLHGSFGPHLCRFYAWDGTSLRQMQPEQWAEWLDRQHRYMRGETHSRD